MPELKITYFDIDGGRGETARLAMVIGGIEFDDDRVPFPQWRERRASTPLQQCPVLTVDGVDVTQCNGINRYVGKLAGLYPDDALQGLYCDEVLEAVEDITVRITSTFGIKDPAELETKRAALVDGPIPKYLRWLSNTLEKHGGEYFADGRLTVADLKVFLWLRHLRSGNIDHVPADIVDTIAPALIAHSQRVSLHPKVAAYYAR